MNNSAALFGVITMITWGLWIVFGDIASSIIDPKMTAFVSYISAAIITGLFIIATDTSFAVTNRGLFFAAIAGVAAAIGVISTFIGASIGSTTTVSTIGGMYFVTTALISTIAFGEPLSADKVVGIILAVSAIIVINY